MEYDFSKSLRCSTNSSYTKRCNFVKEIERTSCLLCIHDCPNSTRTAGRMEREREREEKNA